jgi:hypothetical protein
LKIFIYISIFFFLSVISCKPENSTTEVTGCPKGANCIENGTINGTLIGYCICSSNFQVNAKFNASDEKSLYCIGKPNDTHPTDLPTTTQQTTVASVPTTTAKVEAKTSAKPETTHAPITTTKPEAKTQATPTKKADESDKNEVKVAPAPESHHLFGGIFLPMFIVLAFICGVFAIRKYDLIERAHGYIRNRNQQTRYNGLMENDFDDDPLLI